MYFETTRFTSAAVTASTLVPSSKADFRSPVSTHERPTASAIPWAFSSENTNADCTWLFALRSSAGDGPAVPSVFTTVPIALSTAAPFAPSEKMAYAIAMPGSWRTKSWIPASRASGAAGGLAPGLAVVSAGRSAARSREESPPPRMMAATCTAYESASAAAGTW